MATLKCTVAGQSENATNFGQQSIAMEDGKFVYIKFTTPTIGVSKSLDFSLGIIHHSTDESNLNVGFDLYESLNENAIATEVVNTTLSNYGSFNISYGFVATSLKSNTDYYLRIFMSPAGDTNDISVSIDEPSKHVINVCCTAGIIYIDNGITFDAYECYIDNGTSWDAYIPYIDNGTSWEQYG